MIDEEDGGDLLNDVAGEEGIEDQAVAAMDKALAEDSLADDESVPVVADPAPAAPEPDARPEAVKDADAEIEELKLSERGAARFREMSGEIRELKTALESAGIKDVASLPQAIERAKAADDMIAMVMDTGATAEQYGETLDYLKLVNAAKRGDVDSANRAFAVIEREYHGLAKALGKRVDGVDPLADHADLRAKIGSGALDEDDALEIARLRANQAAQKQYLEQAQQQAQQDQGVESGRSALAAWDQHMLANDPHYVSKRDALSQQVAVIRAQLPPDKWLAATQQLYAALPTFTPPQTSKPAPGPVRPGRVTPPLSRQFEDPMDAINYALSVGE